jgi:diguanylate cyclase (GGDEF)-like protein/PAS domain S-box-containing protein
VGTTRSADADGRSGDGGPQPGSTLPGSTLPGTGTCLGDLAAPAVRVPATSRVAALDVAFRRDPALRWIVTEGPGSPVLLSRSWYTTLTAGRSGRPRRRLRRRRLADCVPTAGPVLAADLPVAVAAAELLPPRSAAQAAEAVVVSWPDGTLGVAPVPAVFEQVAHQYAQQALHDPLTGLPNRLFLLQRLARLGEGDTGVLCSIGLDRFKDINDDLGHSAGDDVLVEFAQRLRSVARADDLVVRLGGDEFAVLTGSTLSNAQSTAFAERIVRVAGTPFAVRGRGAGGQQVVTLSASVGVAGLAGATPEVRRSSLDALLRRAELALSRAKSLGRGRVAHFEDDLLADAATTDAARARHHMERRLRSAIEHGGLTLHHQPVVALPSGQVTGVETLARWNDPELGSVPPDVFIPIAEQTGLIVDLGRWVLQTACREATGWPTGPSGLAPTVAVNVSPVQLAQRGFLGDVTGALRASGLSPERLCLEITETAAITDLVTTAARLGELRELGVRLALDDFGAGHSSLTMLRGLPVHLVKIDRSFIERVTRDTADAVLVRFVIEAAHSLGRRVCAEGVESADQARQLVALGCDAAQGWLFGRPEPASDELARVLGERSQSPGVVAAGEGIPSLPVGGNDELVLATTPDRVITYASASSGPMLGWLPHELLGTSVQEHLHPEEQARAAAGEQLATLHDEGTTLHRVRHRSGAVRWLESTTRRLADEHGRVREVLSVSRDVTSTVQAQRALADSEAMFRHAFDDAPIGMALTTLDGAFLRVNKAFAALVGWTTEQLDGLRVPDITHPDDLAADQANVAEIAAGRAVVQEVAKRYRRPDGSDVPVVVHATVVPGRRGQPAHVFAHILPR